MKRNVTIVINNGRAMKLARKLYAIRYSEMPKLAVHFNQDAFRLYILARIKQHFSVSDSEAQARFHALSSWELVCYLGEYLTGEHYTGQ